MSQSRKMKKQILNNKNKSPRMIDNKKLQEQMQAIEKFDLASVRESVDKQMSQMYQHVNDLKTAYVNGQYKQGGQENLIGMLFQLSTQLIRETHSNTYAVLSVYEDALLPLVELNMLVELLGKLVSEYGVKVYVEDDHWIVEGYNEKVSVIGYTEAIVTALRSIILFNPKAPENGSQSLEMQVEEDGKSIKDELEKMAADPAIQAEIKLI